MHFTYPQKVLFRHCDPARIVFFPRYAEMVNDAVEALFAECFDWPFEQIHRDGAVPTAEINLRFTAPSRHGDRLDLAVTVARIGGASLALTTRATCGEETRFVAEQTLVFVDAQGRPQGWPDAFRRKVAELTETPR